MLSMPGGCEVMIALPSLHGKVVPPIRARCTGRHSPISGEQSRPALDLKYTCPSCRLDAWGKPEINLVCGACDERMEAEETEEMA
jgi:hypothetical protein